MLYLVKLEELEQRYTQDYHRLVVQEAERRHMEYNVIEGIPLTKEIETGAFLDANSTCHYKASQLMEIAQLFQAKRVKEGDIFLVYDLWFPGIEMIRYMQTLNGIQDVRIYGMYFAGSWTDHDFVTPMASWARFPEMGWASICDGVFVGSSFLMQDFIAKRGNPGNLYVTGHPFDAAGVVTKAKEALTEIPKLQWQQQWMHRPIDFIYPHRPHIEKGIDSFLLMLNSVAAIYGRLDGMASGKTVRAIIVTSGSNWKPESAWCQHLFNTLEQHPKVSLLVKTGLTKAQYFAWATRAKIVWSSALQEHYGYAMQECSALGCVPIAPNDQCYPEFYPTENLYDTLDMGIGLAVRTLLNEEGGALPMKETWLQPDGTVNMFDIMCQVDQKAE